MAKKSKLPIAVILTDTHQNEENIDVVFNIFKQACTKAKELGLDKVLHAGDIFDSRKAQPQRQLTSFLRVLDYYREENIILEGIPGNHDKTDYSSEDSFLDPYASHDSFLLHRSWGGWYFPSDNFCIHYLPFFNDQEYLSHFQNAPKNYNDRMIEGVKNVLITHIGIQGAKMNNGTQISSRITSNLFDNYDLVLVGHYHDPQILADGKIKYMGASLQHNHGESYVKGLTVLYDDLSIETIPLNFPKYLKYEIEAKELTNQDIKDLKEEVDKSDNHIRVVLVGKEADIKAVDKSLLLSIGIDVKTKEEAIIKEDLESRVEAFDSKSLLHEFKVFCEKNSLEYKEGVTFLHKILS